MALIDARRVGLRRQQPPQLLLHPPASFQNWKKKKRTMRVSCCVRSGQQRAAGMRRALRRARPDRVAAGAPAHSQGRSRACAESSAAAPLGR